MPIQSPSTKRSPSRIILTTLISLLFLAGTAELSLRLLFGLGNPIVVAPDAACSYIEAPNQHTYRFFHEVRINRYGMRSTAFAPQPAPGTLRIIFFGDSVTYGTSRVGQSDLFTQILRRDLPSTVHQPVEVLNASASGWAIDNELAYARSRGLFHSRLALLVLNDGDLSQGRAEIAGDISQDTTYSHPRTAFGEIWTRFLKPRLMHQAPRKDQGDTATMDPSRIRANLARLDQFHELATAAQARLAIVYLPFRVNIPGHAEDTLGDLRPWALARQVPLFDLTPAEASYPTAAITLDGIHLNARGNRLVAQSIERQWSSLLGNN